jgi:hypothetical protein
VSGNSLNLCRTNLRYAVNDDLPRRARQRLLRTENSLSVPQDHGGMATQWKACAARSSERRVWMETSSEEPAQDLNLPCKQLKQAKGEDYYL